MSDLDKSRFVSNVADEFFCPICFNVLNYNSAIEDDKGHAFCSGCIRAWLTRRELCPLDNYYLNEAKLRPMSLAFKSLLGKLEVYCKYKIIGCRTTCKLNLLENHETNCTLKDLKCTKCSLTIGLNGHECIPSLIDQNLQLKSEANDMRLEITQLKTKVKDTNEENLNLKAKIKELLTQKQEIIDSPTVLSTLPQNDGKQIFRSMSVLHKKTLNYGSDLRKPFKKTEFSINNSDFIVILCHEYDAGNDVTCADMLLYNSNLIRLEKIELNEYGKVIYRIALTDDTIYVAYMMQDTVTIKSFNYDFKQMNIFECQIKNLTSIFHMDLFNGKVCLKTRIYNGTHLNKVFVLNADLTENYLISLNYKSYVTHMIIKNDLILCCIGRTIDIRSFANTNYKKKFNLNSVYSRMIIGPNDNLFFFQHVNGSLSEYDSNVNIVRIYTPSVLLGLNVNSEIRINEAYRCVVSAPARHKLYISD